MGALDLPNHIVGIGEIDPEPVAESGDQRVRALTHHQHRDAEIARRLQIGMHPVAAGRGNQQNPAPSVVLHVANASQGAQAYFKCSGRPQPPAMPQAPQVPAPPVAWNTLLNTKVEPVSRVTKSISTPLR